MRSFLLGLLIVSASAHAQLTQPTPEAVLNSARTRLLADMNRQPRYTCAQNITRQMYRASFREKQSCSTVIAAFEARKQEPPLSSWDRLRLDVAIADNREIHSWPGTPRFSDDEVRRFLGPGVFGTGDFGIFLTGIFGGLATVKFEAERLLDGQTLFDYSYEVPEGASGYHAEAGSSSAVTAYGGSFALNPQTADIVELTIRTAELPQSTGMCQARSQIEYGRVDIHGREVLIPRETRLRVIDPDGREGLNTISYSGCREYSSKSVLRFDDPEPSAAAAAPAEPQPPAPQTPSSPFPPGLAFNCRIMTPIDSDNAAAGSPIEAVLRSPLRGKDKAILAPRGAHLHGRLVRFVDHESPLGYFEVGVRLESIVVDGTELPLYASLSVPAAPPAPSPEWFNELNVADLPAPPPPNVGVFFFAQEPLRVHQLDSAWLTTSPDAGKESPAALAAKTPKQVLEMEVIKKFILAISYSQHATDLLNSTPPQNLAGSPDLNNVLANSRKAIEVGKSADRNILNSVYPGLGDKFKFEFLEAMSLFVQGCEIQSDQELYRSALLSKEWADWYAVHRSAIVAAANR
jgi:hypothetical protein